METELTQSWTISAIATNPFRLLSIVWILISVKNSSIESKTIQLFTKRSNQITTDALSSPIHSWQRSLRCCLRPFSKKCNGDKQIDPNQHRVLRELRLRIWQISLPTELDDPILQFSIPWLNRHHSGEMDSYRHTATIVSTDTTSDLTELTTRKPYWSRYTTSRCWA